MQPTVETEYKYLINEERFMELLEKCNKRYSISERKMQANYYYDTDSNVLNKSNTTVRIRQQHNKMKLQVKHHRAVKDSMALSDEHGRDVDKLPLAMRISEVNDTISLKGVLVTERTIYSFGENSTVCFDVNMYLGVCDYEIEVEFGENDNKEALSVIAYLGLEYRPVMNKSARFFERLEAINHGQSLTSLH